MGKIVCIGGLNELKNESRSCTYSKWRIDT